MPCLILKNDTTVVLSSPGRIGIYSVTTPDQKY